MQDNAKAYREFREAENGVEEAEVMLWIFLHKMLDQRVRMAMALLNTATDSRNSDGIGRDGYSVLNCAHDVWEARLDEQIDSWRNTRIRCSRALQRWLGVSYEKWIEETGEKSAPLIKEILEDGPSTPAVADWVGAKFKRMVERNPHQPPSDQIQ